MNCSICKDSGWVCEYHPWCQQHHKVLNWLFQLVECSGAGMPCLCNKHNPPWDFTSREMKGNI